MVKKEKRVNAKYYAFIAGIMVIKIILMGMCSSDYQNELFEPFVYDFVTNGGNVYQRFVAHKKMSAFPYPPMMLLVESMGMIFIKLFGVTNIFLTNIWFKLPSFVLDFIGLKVLVSFRPEKRRYIAVLYYASPIVIYSVYMHGQLDLIPMVFLMIALFMLMSKKRVKYRYWMGIFFTVIALLCKFHVLAVLPIIFFYIKKRDGLKCALYYIVGVGLGVVIGVLPVWSEGFKSLVLFNTEQRVLMNAAFDFNTVQLYIPIFAVLLVYLSAFKINYMNRELLLILDGIVFAIFLFFCSPMPGWYVWVVPFFCLFFAFISTEKYKNIVVYIGLNVMYLLYFVFLHNRGMVDLYVGKKSLEFLKYNSPIIANGVFTILSGLLLYLIVSMYQLGVASNNFYKRRDIPFTIGVAGDSGAGKSTFVEILEKGLGVSNLLYIEGDGDHRWERGNRFWDEYTALNPKANYLYRQAKDLAELRSGSTVRRVDYDHNTGKFTQKKKFSSRPFVVLCGLHALYLPQTRKHLDLKIYIDSDETLRRYWKIQRDTLKRGHSKEMVLKSIEERMPDAAKYIYPQKQYADLVITYFDKNLVDCKVENYNVQISVRLMLSAAVDIEPLVDELRGFGITAEYDYSDDLENQYVDLDADNLEEIELPIESIAEKVIPQLDEITCEHWDKNANAKDGVMILFLLLLISNKMRGGS